jgi:hypothetical protein
MEGKKNLKSWSEEKREKERNGTVFSYQPMNGYRSLTGRNFSIKNKHEHSANNITYCTMQ